MSASAWSLTDGVIFPPAGLAPEIPEDLYMLIKKVRRTRNYSRATACLLDTLGRRRPEAS